MGTLPTDFIERVQVLLKKAVTKWQKKTLTEMKNILKKKGKGNSNIINNLNIKFIVKGSKITVKSELPDYAVFVDQGRRPGKQPPINNIIAWCKRKGIVKEAAYPIAKKIGEKGIKGTYFMRPLREVDMLLNDIKELTTTELTKAIKEEFKTKK